METANYECVRCLFCRTGKEEAVVALVEEKGWGRALFAKRMKRLRNGQQWITKPAPLLPGYVFVYSGRAPIPHEAFLGLQDVIRVLQYGPKMDTLMGRDLEFATWLWGLNGEVGIMKAVEVGDRVEIVDGVFKQLQGTITKLDRRRKVVRVSLSTDGAIRQIWLAYEIVSRVEELRLPPGAQKNEIGGNEGMEKAQGR